MPENRLALQALQSFSRKPEGVLIARGDVGRGKSWTVGAVMRSLWLPRDPRRSWWGRIERVDEVAFFSLAKAAMDDKSLSPAVRAAVTAAKRADLLVWDDLWSQPPSEWRDTLLYEVWDERRRRGLPSLITTNLKPDVGQAVSARRVESRIYGGASQVVIGGPDWRKQ